MSIVRTQLLDMDSILVLLVLDVEAFERLLGPCMNIMERNSEAYKEDMVRVFGGEDNISDLRR